MSQRFETRPPSCSVNELAFKIFNNLFFSFFSPVNKKGKVYFLSKTSLSFLSFWPNIFSCFFLSSFEIKRHLFIIFSGTFDSNTFNNSSFSLLRIILLGKLELIKFNPCIEDPFSEIYGSLIPSSSLNLSISFSVLLEFGIIIIPLSTRFLI